MPTTLSSATTLPSSLHLQPHNQPSQVWHNSIHPTLPLLPSQELSHGLTICHFFSKTPPSGKHKPDPKKSIMLQIHVCFSLFSQGFASWPSSKSVGWTMRTMCPGNVGEEEKSITILSKKPNTYSFVWTRHILHFTFPSSLLLIFSLSGLGYDIKIKTPFDHLFKRKLLHLSNRYFFFPFLKKAQLCLLMINVF